MRVAWGAVALRVRADARRWWASWLVLGLIVGLAGGTVMAAAAGARRTETAFPRFREETNTPDASVAIRCEALSLAGACPSAAQAVEAFIAHPKVLDATPTTRLSGWLTTTEDEPLQASGDVCDNGPAGFTVLYHPPAPAAGDLLGVRMTAGRDVRPGALDEGVLSPRSADRLGIEVGDVVHLHTRGLCHDRSTWETPRQVTIVGLGFDAFDIPAKFGSNYQETLHVSPKLGTSLVPSDFELQIDLVDGVLARDLLDERSLPDFAAMTEVKEEVTDPIEDGTGADANALWVLALISAVASVLVIGPAAARHRRSVSAEDLTLAGLGWGPRERLARELLHTVAIWIVASSVAIGLGVVVSARTPVGDARAIEPPAVTAPDALAFGIGCALMLLLLAIILARPSLNIRSTDGRPGRSRIAASAADAGLAPPAVIGIRVGLEARRRDVPVRASLASVGLGIAAVVGVLVFTASAERLRATAEDRGIVWDNAVFGLVSDERGTVADLVETAREWPEVQSVAAARFGNDQVRIGHTGRVAHPVLMGGDIEPQVVEGRPASAADEIVANPKLAADLGLGLGDRIDIAIRRDGLPPKEQNQLTGAPTRSFELVGTGPVPVFGGVFGSGLALTFDGYQSLYPADHPLAGDLQPDALLVDRAPGMTDDELQALLAEEGIDYDPRVVDHEGHLELIVSVDRTSTETVPDLLALLMVVTSGGVLLYGLTLALHGSRRDFAIVRALGFDGRLVRHTARWVGLTQVAAALAVAVPLGVVAGRLAWQRYAETIGVVTTDRVAVFELVAVSVLSAVVGILAAIVIGHRQLRHGPGSALRELG